MHAAMRCVRVKACDECGCRAYDNSVGLIDGLSLRRKHWKDHPSRYMLVSFQTSTKPELRESLWNWLCADPSLSSWGRSPETDSLRGISNCAYDNSMDRFAFYTSVVVPSIFVVSPQGFGLDCYRTYEALLLGTYPIVISSDLDVLFKDLPVLILRDWGELSVKLLETTYADFQGRKFDFSTLYVKYWKGQIRSGE
ncbi:hypothetical protein BC830DRAFT_1096677 [Chytriomyces sp. MP71]|nr:hypothetical protein BC830DRAFT_1096677 [Chytriomyces sp. MP71]